MIEFVSRISQLRLAVLAGYACCSLFLVFVRSRDQAAGQRIPPWFVVLSLATVMALRLPGILVNAPFDPDEAQWLASAMKFHVNMNTWLSVDTTSSGPVNVYPLMWPFLFGADTGFGVARITAVAIRGGTWLLTFSGLAFAPRTLRIGIGACLILFLAGTQSSSFIHYSSEVVPVFLLMCALRIVLLGVERPLTSTQICIAGVCLGLMPFAKLQAIIIAAVLGSILLGQLLLQRDRPYRAGGLLAFSACLPGLLLLAPLAAAGGLSDFWFSYVDFAVHYIGGGWGEIQASNRVVASVRATIAILSGRLLRDYFITMSLVTVVAVAVYGRRAVIGSQGLLGLRHRPEALRWLIALTVLGSSIWAVMAPARPFTHYAAFVVWPAALVAGLAWSSTTARTGWVGSYLSRFAGASAIVVLTLLTIMEPTRRTILPSSVPKPCFILANSSKIRPAHGRVLIWGWMPQWYVWSGWTPGTRDIHTYNQIWPTPLREYFRHRLMNDLRSDPPEYIIDAVARGDFGFVDSEKYGMRSFPELAGFVSEGYDAWSRTSPDVSCPVVFARKSMARALERMFVTPSRVYATSDRSSGSGTYSADRVVDGVVFETCPDAWWPNDGDSRREITLDLEPEAIASIDMLNTRGGRERNRASKTVRVMAYRGDGVVLDERVRMRRFPYWTRIALPDRAGPVDRLVVRIETYAGVGGGVNEIRLRRRL
jgi:hypothetical protein